MSALTITDAAATRARNLLAHAPEGTVGLRISVKAKGCSGLSYDIQFANDTKKFEETVTDKGVTILIDPAAVMFLIGSEMDYQDDAFHSGFTFNNPNEKGRCGCGESFHV